MAISNPQSLRILAFGDSLTAGYTFRGLIYHPYAGELKSTLQKYLPSTDIVVDVDGISGDLVSPPGRFLDRMRVRCAETEVPKYDWVIVLGGTNDLGYGSFTIEEIYGGLKQAWNIALGSGAKVLALSIPEAAFPSQSLIRKRSALNQLIAGHVQERWFYMDLCSAVPYFTLDESTRETIWDDGLHLKPEGYDTMGHAIGSCLTEILSRDSSSDTVLTPATVDGSRNSSVRKSLGE